MRRIFVALVVAGLAGAGIGPAIAQDEDYVADPRDRSNGRCQEVGDDSAGENDDNGLSVASLTESVIRLAEDDDECDNSGGLRP